MENVLQRQLGLKNTSTITISITITIALTITMTITITIADFRNLFNKNFQKSQALQKARLSYMRAC